MLLARVGAARERLREAVIAAGGRVVLEEDPSILEPEALQVAAPQVVLVALEPAIEDALERLQPLLESPQLTLVFDEAELAARREGWEAQRWIRHLAAKLHGHGNVLPPGHEHEPTAETGDLPPGSESAVDPVPVIEVAAPAWLAASEPLWQAEPLLSAPANSDEEPPAVAPLSEPMVEPSPLEWAAHRAVLATPVEPPPLPPPLKDFNSWALVDDDAVIVPTARTSSAPPEISSFLTRELSLLDIDQGAAATTGAVLLLAGIGGPDALRRFLGALPETFARPVLVQMRLDGGRYGNLVKQMARVTPLPVLLAEPGAALQPASIYVLPDAVGICTVDGALQFSSGTAEPVISGLPATDSAVVMLSGADQELVDAALALAAEGAWVAGQVSDGCYDPAAAIRLAAHGMSTGDPVYLANALAERWGD